MVDSSVLEDFNSDIAFIEKVMDYRSKLGIHWFLATPSMIESTEKELQNVSARTQVLGVTDMASNRFFPLVMFTRPDMAQLKADYLKEPFNDPEAFKENALQTLSAVEGFCEGVMRCATVILSESVAEFDPKSDFEKDWKKAVESAIEKITKEISKEMRLLKEQVAFPLDVWKFVNIKHQFAVEEKLETGADYSMRALRKKYGIK